MNLPLAPDGVFATFQGEGHLAGLPQTFVRLAGCSVGCPTCDTDYRVARRVDVDTIVRWVAEAALPARERWVWITGGEPTDHDLSPLVLALKRAGFLIALATAGERAVTDPIDWLSVSPHRPGLLAQRFGHECKLVVPALHAGTDLEMLAAECEVADFWFRYVQPRADDLPTHRAQCLDFCRRHPGWGISEQLHRVWGIS